MTWYLDIELVDAYSRRSAKRFEMTAVDHATATADAALILPEFQAVTQLRVLSFSLSERTVYSGTLTTGANRDEGATLKGRKPDGYLATLKIPGPVTSIRQPDGTIDMSDAALVAFINRFTTGDKLLISDGETISIWISGVLDS